MTKNVNNTKFYTVNRFFVRDVALKRMEQNNFSYMQLIGSSRLIFPCQSHLKKTQLISTADVSIINTGYKKVAPPKIAKFCQNDCVIAVLFIIVK